MKKWIVYLSLFFSYSLNAQSNQRVAIVDMDFILKKVPQYQLANKELQKRASFWDNEIQLRKNELKKLKEQLSVERLLLTSQLIEEKEEEIQLAEKELRTYQQSKFGMDGEYFIQKVNLAKPIQDKIFTLINDYAQKKRFTLVLDKSDQTAGMLYAKKGIDISDKIIRQLERSFRKEKLSKKELALFEEQEAEIERRQEKRTKREEMEERQAQIEKELGFSENKQKTLTPQQLAAKERREEISRRKALKRQENLAKREQRRLENIQKQEEIKALRLQKIEELKRQREQKKQERLKQIQFKKESSIENSPSTEDKIKAIQEKKEEQKRANQTKREQKRKENFERIDALKKKKNL